MRAPWSNQVTVSDASLTCIAVATVEHDLKEVEKIGRVQGRARYKRMAPGVKPREHALEPRDPFVHLSTAIEYQIHCP